MREEIDDVRLHERYKEVVEEKKGLFRFLVTNHLLILKWF